MYIRKVRSGYLDLGIHLRCDAVSVRNDSHHAHLLWNWYVTIQKVDTLCSRYLYFTQNFTSESILWSAFATVWYKNQSNDSAQKISPTFLGESQKHANFRNEFEEERN